MVENKRVKLGTLRRAFREDSALDVGTEPVSWGPEKRRLDSAGEMPPGGRPSCLVLAVVA
jgi:hypothetical protein